MNRLETNRSTVGIDALLLGGKKNVVVFHDKYVDDKKEKLEYLDRAVTVISSYLERTEPEKSLSFENFIPGSTFYSNERSSVDLKKFQDFIGYSSVDAALVVEDMGIFLYLREHNAVYVTTIYNLSDARSGRASRISLDEGGHFKTLHSKGSNPLKNATNVIYNWSMKLNRENFD